ncbi:MAG: alpha/beta fold hydrolase [Verrucomicrobiaceae bacterium]|nr:MAG: alpha/beta fold hydrolase [Verrucomicrobiaceae bacterium]
MTPRIIFIHGMFLNPKSWVPWIEFFKSRGYQCEAPAWPMHDGDPAQLREMTPVSLGDLSLATLHRHYAAILEAESQPPVVVGHSMGGLLMQKLAADGLIRAGVGICPVAPNRMLSLDWGFLRNSASITNPFAGDEPYEMTPELFHQNFGNTMTEDESNAAWQALAVNESRQVLRNVMGEDGEIDTSLPHPPFLFVGAEKDEIIPSSLVQRNAHAYSDERSHSEYVEFSSRGHFICGQNGWEEVATQIANWLEAHLGADRS